MYIHDSSRVRANDAIAFASADIGVHMSQGTEAAHGTEDVVLTHADLRGVLVLIELSRKHCLMGLFCDGRVVYFHLLYLSKSNSYCIFLTISSRPSSRL